MPQRPGDRRPRGHGLDRNPVNPALARGVHWRRCRLSRRDRRSRGKNRPNGRTIDERGFMSETAGGGDDVRKEMRAFIEDNFLYLDPDADLADDQDLLAAGIVDSLGFVEIVEEVQARYAVGVQDVEITEENFGSVDAIARYVERKRAEL